MASELASIGVGVVNLARQSQGDGNYLLFGFRSLEHLDPAIGTDWALFLSFELVCTCGDMGARLSRVGVRT